MYVHSKYKSRKFATGGAVILGHGETAIMRPPPGEPPAIEVPSDIPEDAAPADQVAATIARARSFRETPEVHQPVSERSIVSAPVARESVSYSGRREDRPGSITLSIAQKEAARIAGITETAYAQQLIRLREAKANGDYLESR
jgi:hypothetical protein